MSKPNIVIGVIVGLTRRGGGAAVTTPPPNPFNRMLRFLLKEDGDKLLLENGSSIKLENSL